MHLHMQIYPDLLCFSAEYKYHPYLLAHLTLPDPGIPDLPRTSLHPSEKELNKYDHLPRKYSPDTSEETLSSFLLS